MESWVLNTVFLLPSLIVAPMSPGLCSGISITTGWVVEGSNSVDWASFQSKTLRANSITATCIPRHTPGGKDRGGVCVCVCVLVKVHHLLCLVNSLAMLGKGHHLLVPGRRFGKVLGLVKGSLRLGKGSLTQVTMGIYPPSLPLHTHTPS